VVEVEQAAGVRSTYFLRVASPSYQVTDAGTRRTLRDLAAAGFEFGLHYETGLPWHKSPLSAVDELRESRLLLEDVVAGPVRGATPHLPKWVTKAIDRDTLIAAGLLYDPGDAEFNANTHFFSDSNRLWKPGCPCLSLDGYKGIYVLMHPIWWIDEDVDVDDVLRRLRSGE
jgi:hypothetical protein